MHRKTPFAICASFSASSRGFTTLLPVCFLLCLPIAARPVVHPDKDILTEQQTEDLRESANDPQEKLKLYVKYIELRTSRIHQLASDRTVPNRSAAIHTSYEEFADLCDELADNMDSYDRQHEDLRKELKLIGDATVRWTPILKEPEVNEDYDFARKSAVDAGQSVGDSAAQMLEEQEKYFAAQKKDKKGSGN